MFLAPYTTQSHSANEAALRRSNEDKAFAFWQALQRTQDRFGSLFSRDGASPEVLPTNRWFPAE